MPIADADRALRIALAARESIANGGARIPLRPMG